MKNIKALMMICLLLGGSLIAQETKKDTVIFEESPDTTRISWGKSKIIIVAGEDDEEDSDEPKDHSKTQRYDKFAGIDIGVNGFANPDMGLRLQEEAEFLDLNYGKSISFSINFWESYIPIAKEKFGILTGMGFEFNNYDLDNGVDIVTTGDSTFGFENTNKLYSKNRLKSTMLNVPLMLETNIGKDAKHSFHLAAGGLFSYRVGSKTKQKYSENGKDYKVKNRNDYNMNPFRASLAARIGYGNVTLFANYSLTEMFEGNDGPEVYPFTVGISLSSF